MIRPRLARWHYGWSLAATTALLMASGSLAQEAQPPVPVVEEGTVLPGAVVPPAGEAVAPGGPAPAPAAPPAPAPAGQAASGQAGGGQAAPKPEEPQSVWSKVPPARPTPRAGVFPMPPQGPGYYSLLDVLDGTYREKRPVQPYSPLSIMQGPFFDADFRYLDKPDNEQFHWTDSLKRIHLGDSLMFTTGGEFRTRYHNERNSRLTGRDNTYDLIRARAWGDLWYEDKIRLYAEFLWADSLGYELPPIPPDIDRGDLQDLFIDVKMAEIKDRPLYLRIGRQELLYGSQRLISPPDWINVRRSFQGIKGFWSGPKTDIDIFWVQPVIPNAERFDSVDNDQNFVGLWVTRRPIKGQVVDLYYLNLDQARHVASGQGGVLGAFNVSTVGARYHGDKNNFLWDFEGMYQFGTWSNQGISAGAFSTFGGYHFKDYPLNPVIWIGYDYASGDRNPGRTDMRGTFNQLFPFGHYYLGWLDLVGRQNIHDFNGQLAIWPAKWITLFTQYHHFRLDSARDALYSATGAVLRRDPTGRAGRSVGNEIDFVANIHLTQNQDLFIGYSKLFAGDFIKNTGNPKSPEMFYLQYSFRW